MSGSSPLTRGKLAPSYGAFQHVGLIPAHAGKTGTRCGSRQRRQAHPRSRGENGQASDCQILAYGSSPLTRGKRAQPLTRSSHGRLIPAHAGKTSRGRAPCRRAEAHPRSRGENRPTTRTPRSAVGSSPLTRGKPGAPVGQALATRLIPAHAGKTSSAAISASPAGAHPRSRGENTGSEGGCLIVTGSSPLTRGKLRDMLMGYLSPGLIPAHAGKTGGIVFAWDFAAAHPRSRGENDPSAWTNYLNPGSSPLTRGKRKSLTRGTKRNRLIPAHAGKTTTWPLAKYLATGSSPLTRGKLPIVALIAPEMRLIPAHAGKTEPTLWTANSRTAHPRSRGENRL